MGTSYETDIVAWANEQAALLRDGEFDKIDVFHVADEIRSLAYGEKYELRGHLAALAAHLLIWQCEPEKKLGAWYGISYRRAAIRYQMDQSPSLTQAFADSKWLDSVWSEALMLAYKEAEREFPETWPWPARQLLGECLRD